MKKKIHDFKSLDKHFRANLINSIIGIKQASLIGTLGKNNNSNLALFSSAVHLGSNPPLIAVFSRPATSSPKQTMENIVSHGYYTINHVNQSILARAHSCSFNFPENVSEFDQTLLVPEYKNNWYAPYVKDSPISLGCRYLNEYEIKENGCLLIVAAIEQIFIQEDLLMEDGWVDLTKGLVMAINGLDGYTLPQLEKRLEYARPKQINNK